jgi:hypothetical protein
MAESRTGAEMDRKLWMAMRVPVPRPEFVAALRETFSRQEPPSPRAAAGTFRRRWIWILAGVAAVLLSALLLFGPDRVAALIRSIMGCIPGLGTVSDASSARILAESEEISRDGFTVAVVQAVADGRHVGVRAVVFESPESFCPNGDFGELAVGKIRTEPFLRLDSGETLRMLGSSGNREIIMQFPPLPEGIRFATLVMDILQFEFPSGDTSLVMEFPLSFRPLKADDVLPVIEIPGPLSADETGLSETGFPAGVLAFQSLNGMDVILEKVIPLGDRYIFAGSYRWSNPDWAFVGALETAPLRLTDGRGRIDRFNPTFWKTRSGRTIPAVPPGV